MELDKLYLEVTRMCNLECEHCLRGDGEKKFMDPETIVNILNNVKKIDKLLITGGEPLIAIRQIRVIIQMIKERHIEVGRVLLITNSTIMSENVLAVLRELSNVAPLELKLSFDMFHNIELNRLNLLEKRRANAEIFKREFGAKDYGSIEDKDVKYGRLIESKGRALNLTPERLQEINGMSRVRYQLSSDLGITYGPLYYFDMCIEEEKNKIDGTIYIDTDGNIVTSAQSFAREDEEHGLYNANVNEFGLIGAIKIYYEYFKKDKEAWEEKIGLRKKMA